MYSSDVRTCIRVHNIPRLCHKLYIAVPLYGSVFVADADCCGHIRCTGWATCAFMFSRVSRTRVTTAYMREVVHPVRKHDVITLN